MCYASKMFGIKILKGVLVDQFISVDSKTMWRINCAKEKNEYFCQGVANFLDMYFRACVLFKSIDQVFYRFLSLKWILSPICFKFLTVE